MYACCTVQARPKRSRTLGQLVHQKYVLSMARAIDGGYIDYLLQGRPQTRIDALWYQAECLPSGVLQHMRFRAQPLANSSSAGGDT